jgi:peroxiredoxin
MKKAIIAVCTLLALCSCSSNKVKYTINGKIAGAEGTAFLFDGKTPIDTCTLKAGSFTFKGSIANPEIYQIAVKKDSNYIWQGMVFVENGTITLAGNADPHVQDIGTIGGTPCNDAYQSFNVKVANLMKVFYADTSAAYRDSVAHVFDVMQKQFINDNRGNLIGLYMFSRDAYGMDGQAILDSLAKYPADIQASSTAKTIKEEAQRKLNVSIGKKYLEINLPDSSGKKLIKLSDIVSNNKYTLLDFFASWCGPCMAEAPILVDTYAKFHSKGFEIFGVSLDNKAENWKKCLVDKKFTWPNVSDVLGWDCTAAKAYAVTAIPSNFLIDSEGNIVATNLRGDELAAKLSELLK